PGEIDITAPNLVALKGQIQAGTVGLSLDVAVSITDAQGNQVVSDISGTGSGPDEYQALLPVVDSVTNTATGTNQGSILGGDALKIAGAGFIMPPGGEVDVLFYFNLTSGPSLVKTLTNVPVASPGEIDITAPNLVALKGQIQAGTVGLSLDVAVSITDAQGNQVVSDISGTGSGPDEYQALLPVVDSVTNTATGTNQGSILGGDALKIAGAGFIMPPGGEVDVLFYFNLTSGPSLVKTLTNVPVASPGEIDITAPNLVALKGQIQAGTVGLSLDVAVSITDAQGNQVVSDISGTGSGPDEYQALLPVVDSVTNTATGTNQGSILGGDALKIAAAGFIMPPGGEVDVLFYFNLTSGPSLVKTLTNVPVASPGEIDITAPNLVARKGQIQAGTVGLSLDVAVSITDAQGNQVVSDISGTGSGPDEYQALLPVVDSVTNTATG